MKTKQTVDQIISAQFRKIAAKITTEQRKKNGKASWRTRRANIAKRLAAS